MISLFLCHLQRSFLFDLSYCHTYLECITKFISFSKRRLFDVTRALQFSILAFALLFSFQLILLLALTLLQQISAEKTDGVKHSCSIFIISVLFFLARSTTLLETVVSISGNVWVENSYVKYYYLTY